VSATRVALVCEPPDGGVAEHVARLALQLREHGYEPTVVAPAAFAPRELLASARIPLRVVHLRRDYRHPWAELRALAELHRALRRERFALVHAHAAKAGVLARAAALGTRTRTVYSPHCFPFVGEMSGARRRFATLVERVLAPATDALVCVCDEERAVAAAHRLAPRMLATVHNGCPLCPDVEPDPELTALRAGGPLVGAVTVLRRQKGLETLIESVEHVRRAVPAARFAIVGGGPEERRLRALAGELGAGVRFLPFRPPSARALRALDLFVLPSRWEAFPIGLLEAQACGVPQVVADVGGNREAVTAETGLVVSPGDAVGLADAIVALLADPARRAAMSLASRSRHAERFTLERMVAATAAVYDRVLGQ
jgi:glycosyltransferase involved in cell wall biosynthesis